MRDYVIILVVLGSLPIGLFRPFYGLLVYAWISYGYPHNLAWSFAQTFPVAKLSALSVMGGLLFSPTGNVAALRQKENIAMLLLWCTFTISTAFAIYPDQAWVKWQDASKLILMSILATALLQNRAQLRLFVLTIALSLGFWGFKGGLFGLATGGNQLVFGPEPSIIGANNAIGLALDMCVPLLWYLASEERGWLKRLLQLFLALSIPAIMFTYSRGSSLALAVVLLLIVLKSKHRIPLLIGAVIAGVLAIPFIPQKWLERQQTVVSYGDDSSAMSRVDNWKFCWRVAQDYPLTGAGFDWQSREMFERYAPEFIMKYKGKIWNTHNIFFSILTSHGFPGLFCFVAMILFCMASCTQLKWSVRRVPELAWVRTYSDMIQLSLVAFVVNGMFVNMEYFDLPYHWVSVIVSLKIIVSRELSEVHAESPYITDNDTVHLAAT